VIEIIGTKVRLNGIEIEGEYPVYDARQIGQILLVLYRPDARRSGQFRNLVAFDASGRELWKAELPTGDGVDSYYQLVSERPIIADSYCSYRCTIDEATGRIIKKTFFK
jgi:hypothetical protein